MNTLILILFFGLLFTIGRPSFSKMTAIIQKHAPAPDDNLITEDKINLGKLLFFDTRLSSNKKISCNSCHNIKMIETTLPTGTDSSQNSVGVFGVHGQRNAPTIWNVGYREFLFWDGRAKSLEDQAKGPILNPIEMGMKDEAAVVAAIQSDTKYQKLFKKVFHQNKNGNHTITFDEIIKALTTFERTLNTPNSDFDRYQNGELNALSSPAKNGWDKFQKIGCISCHAAPTFLGKDYFVRFPLHEAKEYVEKYNLAADAGRHSTTKVFKDQNLWRVPSLRNVAITSPYFHNGSVDSLKTAIKIMGKGQLQKELSDEDINDLEAFLKSLTGRAPVIKN